MSGSSTGLDGIVSEDKLYGTDQRLTSGRAPYWL